MWKVRNRNFEITNKHYYKILIVTYILVGALAQLIMITSLFSWFNSYLKKQIFEMGIEQLDNIDNIYENYINLYHTQLQNTFQEPDIKNYLYSASSEFAREYKISRSLNNIISNNGVIDYICLYRNQTIDFISGASYPGEKEQKSIITKLQASKDDMQYFLIKQGEKQKLCIFQTERETLYGKPERGIIYIINLTKLQKKILEQNHNGNYLFIFSKDGEILAEKDKIADKDRLQIWNVIRNQTETYKSKEIVLNQIKYICNSKSNVQGNTYIVMLQDFQFSSQKLKEAGKNIFITSVPVLLLVLLISVIMANKIYYPIKKFFNELWDSSSFMVLGDEDYSIKKMEMTNEKILSQINAISSQYYSNKILRYLGGNTQTDLIPSALMLSDRGEQCIFVLFWTEYASKELNELSIKVHSTMETLCKGCKLQIFKEEDGDSFLLLIKEQKRINKLFLRDELKAELMKVINEVEKEKGIRCFCAISKVIDQEKELRPYFSKVFSCTKYNILGQSEIIMDTEALNNKIDADIPKKNYSNILDCMKAGDCQTAIDLLEPFLRDINGYEIKRELLFLAEFATEMNQIASGFTLNSKQYQTYYLNHYVKITSLFDQKQLVLYFSQIMMDTCLETKVAQEKSIRINMMDSIAYIQENYKSDTISLEQVADRFHISVSYFSRLFNEYAGMTFPEYVNDLRLTYAKELLLINPEANVKKIAEVCGFNSVSYFSAQFKKKFGSSPSAYRNNR
ncbi:helix-turn-helix transcriptional regulator [Anaerocolumna jejuensis]|uniref:helix-turn-helix transcriptional regulator n=1 Tax=Anaerocolumna jejuensis TaxID=259063 RepID=UPI003F7C88D7